MRDPIYSLRKNASLSSVAAATRKRADQLWAYARTLREVWQNSNPGAWSETKRNYDKAADHAIEISRIADHLERLS